VTACDAVSEGGTRFVVMPMRLSDVPNVLAIERASFPSPWPARAYRYEITRNEHSHYFVARCQGRQSGQGTVHPTDEGKMGGDRGVWRLFSRSRLVGQRRSGRSRGEVIGYIGFWTSGRRAHVSTLAVAPQWRRRGVGLLLMLHILSYAMDLGMREVTLEVRVSNQAAQNLYRKCGFKPSGLQRGYYHDNSEDALLMRVPALTDPGYRAHLSGLWKELEERLGHPVVRRGG